MKNTSAASAHIEAPAHWPEHLREEFERGQYNGCVGTTLLSENDRARVWEVRLKPGERLPFHRHLLSYFWTATTDCKGLSHFSDGRILQPEYKAGDTKHMEFGAGEFMVHDIQNIGDTDFVFTTVEFLDSANAPLPIPDQVRRKSAA